METPEPNRDEENALRVPPELLDALRGLEKEAVFIPPVVDEAVLKQARPRLAQIRRHRARRNRILVAALAASVVLMLGVAEVWLGRSRTYAVEDVNHDGRVDILDAFQLAREVRQGTKVPGGRDLNGDGRVDEADVAIIANRAVRLEDGGRL